MPPGGWQVVSVRKPPLAETMPACLVTRQKTCFLEFMSPVHTIGRPLLLNVYKAADALPYTANPLPSSHAEEVVRGERARWAHHDPRPCLIPPDWSGGYTSLFALQQKKAAPATM